MTESMSPEDTAGPSDVERAQRFLIASARMGSVIGDSIRERVGLPLTSNAEILILTSLDLLGPQRPSDILEQTGMTSGGVTKALDRLERQGVLTRDHGGVDGDRRGISLVLTPKGQRVAREMAASVLTQVEVARDALDAIRELVEAQESK